RYLDFMEWVFCNDRGRFVDPSIDFSKTARRALPFTDTDAYRNVKAATEAFVMANCGIVGAADGSMFDSADAAYVNERVVLNIGPGDLEALWDDYTNRLDDRMLPYLALVRRKLKDNGIKEQDIGDVDLLALDTDRDDRVNTCYGVLRQRLTHPCLLELIWSYWQEEGMLVQTMNAIARR
ncbi:hypothetical protein, partial [Rhodoplanes sp. SY1]|uniref:hypothetical protein n=1 Tax=Rhodoplanes sp. SY1 TaxID=3166646 RepID=UPI0038B481A1